MIYPILAFTSLFLAIAPYSVHDYSYLIGMDGFSKELLTMHFKLYEGYVKNTNELIEELQSKELTPLEYGALKRRLGWEFDGMRLHELYFDHLGGTGVPSKQGKLIQALTKQWGSYEKWRKEFIRTGSIRGIGWVVLYQDPQTKRFYNTWVEEHDMGHLVTATPLIVMDVFEHAYMPQYGLDRGAYIDAFFTNLDWDVAEDRYMKSLKDAPPY